MKVVFIPQSLTPLQDPRHLALCTLASSRCHSRVEFAEGLTSANPISRLSDSLSTPTFVRQLVQSPSQPHRHFGIMVTTIAWALNVVSLREGKGIETELCSEQGRDKRKMVQTLLHSGKLRYYLPSRVLSRGESQAKDTAHPMSRIQEVTLSTKES